MKLKNSKIELHLSNTTHGLNDFIGYLKYFYQYKWMNIYFLSAETNQKICQKFGFKYRKLLKVEESKIEYHHNLRYLDCSENDLYKCVIKETNYLLYL